MRLNHEMFQQSRWIFYSRVFYLVFLCRWKIKSYFFYYCWILWDIKSDNDRLSWNVPAIAVNLLHCCWVFYLVFLCRWKIKTSFQEYEIHKSWSMRLNPLQQSWVNLLQRSSSSSILLLSELENKKLFPLQEEFDYRMNIELINHEMFICAVNLYSRWFI